MQMPLLQRIKYWLYDNTSIGNIICMLSYESLSFHLSRFKQGKWRIARVDKPCRFIGFHFFVYDGVHYSIGLWFWTIYFCDKYDLYISPLRSIFMLLSCLGVFSKEDSQNAYDALYDNYDTIVNRYFK